MKKLLTSGLTALVLAYMPLQESRAAEQNPVQSKYTTRDVSQDSDVVLLARLLFGEARNCTKEEKIAVAYTVLNRVRDGKKSNGSTVKEVILKPWQYSSFNTNDPNREKLMNPEKYDASSFSTCLTLSSNVLAGKYSDPTKGATHYFNPQVVRPAWASKLEKVGRIPTLQGLSKHEFYREH